MGPRSLAKPLSVFELVKDIELNKVRYSAMTAGLLEAFKANDVVVEDGRFELGEVSFHHNLSFHTAASNRTRQSRIVLANTTTRTGRGGTDQPTMVSGDWQKFIPGASPGDVAASELNPVCWPVET